MKLPKSLTRVTPFSKSLALLLTIAFIAVAFYSGMLFQQKAVEIAGNVTPTPTPIMSPKTSCSVDSDCVFTTEDTKLSCCPNTRCIRYGDEGVIAVSASWFEKERTSVCGARNVCPMFAIMCTRSITEENNHYSAKCVRAVCTKVRS